MASNAEKFEELLRGDGELQAVIPSLPLREGSPRSVCLSLHSVPADALCHPA